MRLRLLAAASAMLFLNLAAKADSVLYSQSVTTKNSYFSYSGSLNVADSFSLASTATINSVDFYGEYIGSAPATDQFTLSIFSSANNAPKTVLASVTTLASKVDTGSKSAGTYEIFHFNSSLPAFLATANTAYFLQIVSTSSTADFAWSTGNGTDGTHESSFGSNTAYANATGDLAFSLAGSIADTPEPSSLALLGTGLLGLAGVARRRFA